MKLCTLLNQGNETLGVKQNGQVIDINHALTVRPAANIPTTITELIAGGEQAANQLGAYVQTLETNGLYIRNELDCQFGPAVTNPEKIICVGLNYRKHADETNSPYPEVPILFNKFNNTLTGHDHDIAVPSVTNELDYEVELAIVIGKTAKNVSEEKALEYVLGYTIANDLSARDLQMRTPQWLLGKTCDDFSPIGPYLVTADEVGDPQKLSLQTTVNNETRQHSNTSDMIFNCKEIISYISKHFTLKPGDIILTGTPEGVVMGLPEQERIYLKPGDTVSVSIEKLGTLTNRFVKE
ncbi:fumarylacetoacetate hydrolase family protein [Shouchella patagoniensis]|uniref:fumarylacetoacetate hydrolase family protein n=1 Tax=Shouchella patagoniensis TaxID=228576 RepID=UPI000995817F|nr:fumarylacetoacetate hydrolase family protein [Shouchella patagoniensis]